MKKLLQRIISFLGLSKNHEEIEVPQEPKQEVKFEKNIISSYRISGYDVLFLEIVKKIGDIQIEGYVTEVLKDKKTILVAEYNDKEVAEFYHYRALREVLDISKINKELASKIK